MVVGWLVVWSVTENWRRNGWTVAPTATAIAPTWQVTRARLGADCAHGRSHVFLSYSYTTVRGAGVKNELDDGEGVQ